MIVHRPNRFVRISTAALLAAATLTLASRTARADTSCTPQGNECSKGFTCQMSAISGCASPACAPGTTCDASPSCESAILYTCQPGPCTTDSDCAAGMVCHADTYETCASSAPSEAVGCAKGDECDVPAPAADAASCTTTTAPMMCVPQYDLPCTVNADCGDGFTCTPETVTTCSGSGAGTLVGSGTSSPPSISADAGTTEPATDDAGAPTSSCVTTTLTTSQCQVNSIVCTTDSDCPATWTCAPQLEAVSNIACAEPAELVDGSAVAPACDAGAIPAGPSMCQPPYPVITSGSGASSDGAGENPAASGAPSVPAASGSPATNGTDEQASGGCQIGSSPTGAAPGSLPMLVGLIGVLFQRRSNRRRAIARR